MSEALFNYPSRVPSYKPQDRFRWQDIVLESASGNRVEAFLLMPNGTGPYPAILYTHWYESESPIMNRSQFLSEAAALAQHGVASLLVNTLWSNPTWYRERQIENDFQDFVKQVIDLRQALDLLCALPQVDSSRLAYVGHDFGGMLGMVLSSVEKRVSAYVIMAAAPKFEDWMLYYPKLDIESREKYIEGLRPLDPINFVGQVAPAPILFQFGKADFYVNDAQIQALYEAANAPKTLETYDGGHGLNEEARDVRVRWLQKHLGFSGAVPLHED